jgi:hypothetical protein
LNIDPNRFGIREGINELIVTTLSIDGEPNAAPIGIIQEEGKFTIRVFNQSQTCTNIKDTGLLAANVVNDPVLFVRSALGNPDSSLFEMVHAQTSCVFPVLTHSCAWILFEADCKAGKIAMTAELYPVDGCIIDLHVCSVNRGFNAVIEALILATRYRIFGNKEYLDQIKSYDSLVKKCGSSREIEAYELIFELL